MTQTWDPKAYSQNGAFVHGLAGGVLEWLAAKPGENILDLGCGDGQLTERVALTGAKVVGVDASPEMVRASRERGIEAIEANAVGAELPTIVGFKRGLRRWQRGPHGIIDQAELEGARAVA